MAKIHEEIIVVKISKLVKDNDDATDIVGNDVVAGLEAVVQEMVGDVAVVEVIRG